MTTETNNNHNLEGKLVESIKIEGLGKLVQEYTELGLDMVTDEGILKDIPIIGTLVKTAKVVGSVRDRIYLKKLIRFLGKVGETTQEQREKFIEDNCKNTKKFEEAVLLILEQSDNMNKSALIGKVFKACILGRISYQDSLSLSCIVNKTLWQDLENMFQKNFNEEMKMRLCSCGLLNLDLRRRTFIDDTKVNTETKETIDGFNYCENSYYRMLLEIAEHY
jgi:hypothetical protein